jgi:hypothetical protein
MESNVTPSLWTVFAAVLILVAPRASADPIACGMAGYKTAAGLAASIADDVLTIGWTGGRGQDVRMRFSIEGGTPTIREPAIRKAGGAWRTLASNVVPDYAVRGTGNQRTIVADVEWTFPLNSSK